MGLIKITPKNPEDVEKAAMIQAYVDANQAGIIKLLQKYANPIREFVVGATDFDEFAQLVCDESMIVDAK